MTSKRRLTSAEYAEMSADCAANPPTADEVTSIEALSPAVLRQGRPTKGTPTTGRTPVMTVRLPTDIRNEVQHRVSAGEARSEGELVRRAVVEYFENHPAH
jgi:hypothetical protein